MTQASARARRVAVGRRSRVSPCVRAAARSFASLRMTGVDLLTAQRGVKSTSEPSKISPGMSKLSGIFTPHMVPLDARGEINEAELRRYIDWLIDSGVHGLYPNGSTGEFTRFTA